MAKSATCTATKAKTAKAAKATKSTRSTKNTPKTISRPRQPKAAPSRSKLSPMQRCIQGGPNGPPVYDELGYELDYKKCKGSMTVRSRASRGSGKYMKMIDDEIRDDRRRAEIVKLNRNLTSSTTIMACDFRVAKDLEIPYHKVTMESYEEWARKGLEVKEGEFIAENIAEKEKDEMLKIAVGSAFRK